MVMPLLFKVKKNWEMFLLILLCLVIIISHCLYVFKTYQYPSWDEHQYMSFAISYFDLFKSPSLSHLQTLWASVNERQPLYSLFIAFALFPFGLSYSYKIALLINGFFFVLTIISIYFIGKMLFDRKVAILGSFIFATYGFPLFYLHFTYTETAATAFVTTSLLFLLKTNYLKKRKYVILFSIFFAAALLTRWTTPLFIIGPLLFIFLKRVYQKKFSFFMLNNILLFICIGILFPLAVYYIPKANNIMNYFQTNISVSKQWVSSSNYLPSGLQNQFSESSMMFYFNIISQQTVYFFALFVVGFFLSILNLRKYFILLIAFAIPYLFFAFLSVFKDDRFIVPLYPIIAITSALVFYSIKNRFLLMILIGITVILGTGNFLAASWAMGPLGFQGLKDIVLPRFIHHPRRIYLTTMIWPPTKDTGADRLMLTLYKINQQTLRKNKKKPLFLHAYYYGPLETALYGIVTYEKRNLKSFDYQQKTTFLDVKENDYITFFKKIKTADYIIIKDKNPIQEDIASSQTGAMLGQFIKVYQLMNGMLPKAYKKIDSISIPADQSNLIIYEKTRLFTPNELDRFDSIFIHLNNPFQNDIVEASRILIQE